MSEHAAARELKWFDADKFSGWGCTACRWHIASAATLGHKIVAHLVKEAFDRHRCKGDPHETLGSIGDNSF